MIAGYFGGTVDMLLMRTVDVLYALPSLLFVIIIMTYLRGTLDSEPRRFLAPSHRFDGNAPAG